MADNVSMKVTGSKLTITVDLNKELGLSKSQKNMTIATTGGNMDVPDKPGYKLGLNVYKPKGS